MREEFVKWVSSAASLLRKRDIRGLGKSALVSELPSLLRRHLPQPVEYYSTVLVGDVMKEVLRNAIESMRPSNTERDTPLWRSYTFLKEYIWEGKEWGIVASDLAVARSTFYSIRKEALEAMALLLWRSEEEAKMAVKVKHNLQHQVHIHEFVPRQDNTGRDYVMDVFIPELRDGKAWLISVEGEAGVGKSTLIYKVAEEVEKKRDEHRLQFEAVIWLSHRSDPRITRQLLGMPPDLENVWKTDLNLIGTTLGKREILQIPSNEEKQLFLEQVLKDCVCLFIFDNMDSEYLPDGLEGKVHDFIYRLPRQHKSIITKRKPPCVGEKLVKIGPMTREEAKNYIRMEIEALGVRPPLAEMELEKLLEHPYANYPLVMSVFLGSVRTYPTFDEALEHLSSAENIRKVIEFYYLRAYQRLPSSAKNVLVVLPLFRDMPSSEDLQVASGISSAGIYDAIGKLCHAHMIERVERPEYAGYDAVPLVRGFIAESIWKDPQVADFCDKACERLTDYYLEALDVRKDRLDSTLLFLRREKGNVIKIMEWCYDLEKWEEVQKFVELMGIPLGVLRYLDEKILWGRRAMKASERLGQLDRQGWFAVRDVAWSYINMGTNESRSKAKELLEEILEQARNNRWEHVLALTLRDMAELTMDEGEYEKAQEMLKESLDIWESLEQPQAEYWKTISLRSRAKLWLMQGLLEEAAEQYHQLLNAFVDSGDLSILIGTHSSLALIEIMQGKCEEARRRSDLSIEWAQAICYPASAMAFALSVRAQIERKCGNEAEAKKRADEARKIYEDLGMEYHANILEEEFKLSDR
nr:NACHT domain-containing protein [Chloroflexota bacterium]